jgi:hypothetical protein
MKILKYTMTNKGNVDLGQADQIFDIPGLLRPLHVGMQNGNVTLWVAVEESKSFFPYKLSVRLIGTGRNTPDDYIYLGTVMDGEYVWHVFTSVNYK